MIPMAAKRLREMRETRGLSREDLARRAGCHPNQIVKLERGERKLTVEWMERLSKALGQGAKPEDFLQDAVKEPITANMTNERIDVVPSTSIVNITPDIPPISRMPRDVPVLGIGVGGKDGVFDFNGNQIDWVRRPPRLEGVPGVFAIYLTGGSMSPWREHGQAVYVHPTQPPSPSDHVLVQLKPGREGDAPKALVKKLVRRTERELRLLQYSPRRELKIPMKDVLTIQKVIDWSELLGI